MVYDKNLSASFSKRKKKYTCQIIDSLKGKYFFSEKEFCIYDKHTFLVFFFSNIEHQWVVINYRGWVKINGMLVNKWPFCFSAKCKFEFYDSSFIIESFLFKERGLSELVLELFIKNDMKPVKVAEIHKLIDRVGIYNISPNTLLDCISKNTFFEIRDDTWYIDSYKYITDLEKRWNMIKQLVFSEYDNLQELRVFSCSKLLCTKQNNECENAVHHDGSLHGKQSTDQDNASLQNSERKPLPANASYNRSILEPVSFYKGTLRFIDHKAMSVSKFYDLFFTLNFEPPVHPQINVNKRKAEHYPNSKRKCVDIALFPKEIKCTFDLEPSIDELLYKTSFSDSEFDFCSSSTSDRKEQKSSSVILFSENEDTFFWDNSYDYSEFRRGFCKRNNRK